MEFELLSQNPWVLKIKEPFTKEENKEILNEAIKLKRNFISAVIGSIDGTGVINKKYRTNTAMYYDPYYENKREQSQLLRCIDQILSNMDIHGITHTSRYPLNQFSYTNFHETQVSRYGNEGQKYDWHVDAGDKSSRMITFVYYFNSEPKKYKGGEITFTSSPLHNNIPLDDNAPKITVIPENNTAYMFDSWTPHAVSNTKSPDTFKYGRFSVNTWIGIK